MSANCPSLAQLHDLTNEDIACIPVDQIELLLEELATLKADAKRYDSIIHAEMSRRFSADAARERSKTGRDTGTARLSCGDRIIVADLPKEVSWDQPMLSAVASLIRQWEGEELSDYIDIKYSVQEKKFNAWPHTIREYFEPSRTVKTGKATYKIEARKEGV